MSEPSPAGNFHPADAPSYESILQCMRCGFCLAVCPTYALTNRERSSPRGRAALARAVAGTVEFYPGRRRGGLLCLDCGLHDGVPRESVSNDHGVLRSQGRASAPFPPAALRDFILKRMLPPVPDGRSLSPSGCTTSAFNGRTRFGMTGSSRRPGKMEGIPAIEGHSVSSPSHPRARKSGAVSPFLGCAMSLVFPEVSRQTAHPPHRVRGRRRRRSVRGAPHPPKGPGDRPPPAHQPRNLLGLDVEHRHRLRGCVRAQATGSPRGRRS
jgi:glycolate oxidase iron-sulfur subunit